VEKRDFSNIDLSKIKYKIGEKISYKKYFFEIKEDFSIKELMNQEEINDLENLIIEKMESSNWNKLVELNKNKKEVKEKKFKDWIEPIKTAFKEDIPTEIYYKYFKKFNLQVVPSLRETKDDGTLLFRNDRSFILKFSEEEKKNFF
jgi:DNA-binding cell septation regulator SpoVG